MNKDEEMMKSKLKEAGEQVQKAQDTTHKVRMELAEKVNMLDAMRKQVREQGALVRQLS